MDGLIGSARLYEWSPSIGTAWGDLLRWVSDTAGVAFDVIPRDVPMGLEELWARTDMGCVMMCGYPWALAPEPPRLLAAPVPAPPRYGDRPVYVSDFVVPADSSFETLEDSFGHRFAYSTEHSQSGYNAARYHLLPYRTPERPTLFGEVAGPYMRQGAVLDALAAGEADIAAVDGFALDLLRHHDPESAGRVRVVATTEPAPIPPMVTSLGADDPGRQRLVEALLAFGTAPGMAATREALLLRRFETVSPEAFDELIGRQHAAEDAGYAKIA